MSCVVMWNRLQINLGKSWELEVDFHRHAHSCLAPLNIQGKDVEMVASYTVSTWVVTLITNWTRLYLLRELRRFGVQGGLLKTFYSTVVTSTTFNGVVC